MTATKIPLLCATISLLLAASVAAEDWPRFRGPDGNGISRETGWFKPWNGEPRILWRAAVGHGFASFAVAKGKVYTTGNENDVDTLFCFDAATGKEIWKHSYPSPLLPKYYEGGTNATPTVDGDHLYHLGKVGHLFCFEAATGKVVWQKQIADELGLKVPEWGFASSPLIDGDVMYLNAGSAGLALDKNTGAVVWQSGKESAAYATPVPYEFDGRKMLAIPTHRELVGVRADNGEAVWRMPFKSGYDTNAADPIIWQDKLIVSAHDLVATMLQLTGGQPKPLGKLDDTRIHLNTGVVIGDHLYQVHGSVKHEGDLRCIDLKTRKVVWKQEGLGVGALTAADGKLIVLSEKGELAIVTASPDGCQELARAQVLGGTCWAQPVLANGRIYARNHKGDVVCVQAGEGPPGLN